MNSKAAVKTCQALFSRIFLLDSGNYLLYTLPTMKKLSFVFDPDDVKLIEKLKKTLTASQGKTSNIAVIRYALREAVK